LVQEALEREHWRPDQWKTWENERLAGVLERAATRVPYYRDYWAKRTSQGAAGAWLDLSNWPVLRKQAVRENPRAFLADDCDARRMFHEHTSGTTGSPVQVWFRRSTVRQWYALFEARCRGWNGLTRHDRWAILGSKLVVPFRQERPPFWVWNAGLNQLYLSTYHLAAANAPAYVEALQRYRVVYLWGYASALATLASYAQQQGLKPPKLAAAISNAEPLYEHQRRIVAEVFQCPVLDTYGMVEAVCGASHCEHGALHLWPEAGVVEVLSDDADEPAPPGSAGRLVCTGLLNADMPLVRYEVGDGVTLAPAEKRCACGRTLPIVEHIEGRNTDMLLTANGRRVFWLNPVFYGMPVQEAQIIQEVLDRVRVKVVPCAGFGDADVRDIMARVQQRLGKEVKVIVEPVTEIPRTKAGKFQAVVSLLSQPSPRGKHATQARTVANGPS
jgi:phenylacetate-CoA ligase